MNNKVGQSEVKRLRLPGLPGEFLMVGDYVYKADTKEQAFAYSDGTWIMVRKSNVPDPQWVAILEKNRAS